MAGKFPVTGAHTLQLGAAVWMNGTYPNLGDFSGGWFLIEEDMSMAKRNAGLHPHCFNANSKDDDSVLFRDSLLLCFSPFFVVLLFLVRGGGLKDTN